MTPARAEALRILQRFRRELAESGAAVDRPVIPVFTDGTGPQPGLDLTSSRALQGVLDEGRDFTELRG